MSRPKTDFTNIKCLVCGKDLLKDYHPYREYDKEERRTGRWFCASCYGKEDRKSNPNNLDNRKKLVRNCRTGNQYPNHTSTKGDNCIELSCIMYGYVDLNKKYDNYITDIDCQDPKTGLLYQIRGARYSSAGGRWDSGPLERDWHKDYESMIYFCLSEGGKRIERIYKIPSSEIKRRRYIGVYNEGLRTSRTTHWYEKYRVDNDDELKKANNIWRKILEKEKRKYAV